MLWDAGAKLDLDEDECKFLDLIVGFAKGNEIVLVEEEVVKKRMEQEGIAIDKYDALVKKMEGLQILKDNRLTMKSLTVDIDSSQAKAFQHEIKEITCPACGQRTLKEKAVIYCPMCDYLRDKKSKS